MAKKAVPSVEILDNGAVVITEDAEAEALDAEPTNPNEGIDPGAEGFDWQHEYPDEKVFVFTADDGTTVGLAALSEKRAPKPGEIRKLRKQDQFEQMFFLIEHVACDAALDISDEFEREDYAAMFEAWSEWNVSTAGESSRSSAS